MVDAVASLAPKRQEPARPLSRDATALSVAVTPATPEALEAYARLAGGGLAAPAQSAAWVRTWAGTAAADLVIAVASSGQRPVFAIALEAGRLGPFKVAALAGGTHANGNFCAVDPGWAATAGTAALDTVFKAMARARPDLDAVVLERLLPSFQGINNPLSGLPRQDSPNLSLAVDLRGGFDALLSRTEGRKRKKHRAQARKFEAAGGYRRIEARTPGETARLLEAFFAMKQLRFQKMGIADVFADAGVRRFFQALFRGALEDRHPAFVLHALEVGGVLRAVTGSSRTGDRIVCEFGAIADDGLGHLSPGDFLFYGNIEEACAEGLAVYDYSVGDEPYKRLWCDIETRHFDVIVPLTARGRLLAAALRLFASFKSRIKGSPQLWKLARTLRRHVAGR